MLNRRNIKIIRLSKLLDYKNFELFKITKALNNFAYELELSTFINDIYSIFYLWLLYLDNSDLLLE